MSLGDWFRKLAIGSSQTEDSALLEVISTSKGSIPAPRMTEAQRDAISSPAEGLKIYNLDENQYEYYDGTEWKRIGGGAVMNQELLGVGDGVTTVFVTSFPATDDNGVLVFANTVKEKDVDFTFSFPNTVIFTTPPAPGVDVYVYYPTEGAPLTTPTPTGTYNVSYTTVTAGDITAKKVTLSAAVADPTHVLVDVIQGSSQQYGVDFIVTGGGADLSWDGLGLESTIAENDVLRIVFIT